MWHSPVPANITILVLWGKHDVVLQLCELSFNKTRHLRNAYNENLPVKDFFSNVAANDVGENPELREKDRFERL